MLIDAALALGASIVGVLSLFNQALEPGMHEPDAFSVIMAVGACSTILAWRRYPVGALVVGSVFITIPVIAGYPEGLMPLFFYLLIASMAARSPLNRSLAGLAWSVCVVILLTLTAPRFSVSVATSVVLAAVVAWLLGAAIHWRLESARTAIALADQRAESERQRAATAVTEERLRIAQDLHDVLAHSMSVIAVQAGMGSHVLDQNPAQARAALDAISGISRSTLTEMRRLLSVLRAEDGAPATLPAPGLGDVPALVEDVRAAGLPVTLSITGERVSGHPGVELSAYRVVQEALTNVMKHAGTTSEVVVSISYQAEELSIEVTDDGRGSATRSPAPGVTAEDGHGLLGMRERVQVWGGQLSTGPRPGGGYRVRATLPYGVDA